MKVDVFEKYNVALCLCESMVESCLGTSAPPAPMQMQIWEKKRKPAAMLGLSAEPGSFSCTAGAAGAGLGGVCASQDSLADAAVFRETRAGGLLS